MDFYGVRTRWLLIVVGWSSLAGAQVTAPPVTALPEVVVTATRTAEPAYDIPAAIDAIDADRINNDQLGVNITESVAAIPGLLARDRHNYAQDDQISIRGFGAGTTFGVVGVRLYYDGIPASFPDGQGQVSNFNLESAQRIEVLRGPFSALYGNSSGGVVQVFTADGTAPPSVHVGLAYGSFNTVRADIGNDGAYGPLDYNFDFTHFRFGGYRRHSSARREIFNGKVNYRLDGASRLTFVLNSFSGPEAQDPQGLTRAEYDADPNRASPSALAFDTRKSVEQTRGGLIYRHQFGQALTLRAMGYFGRRLVRQFLSVPVGAQRAPTSGGGVIDLHDGFGGSDLRLTWRSAAWSRPLTVVGGLAYDTEDEHRFGYNNFIGSQLGVQGALRRDEDDIEYNFDEYLQADWRFAQAWSVFAGVRHSQVGFDSRDHFIAAGNGDDSGKLSYYATTPVVGVMYRTASWAHLYTSFGEGFQTPTFAQLAYRPDGSGGLNLALKPARSENLDLGAKLRLGSDTAGDLTLFRALTRNELVVATNAGGRSTYTNANRTRRQGVEVSIAQRLGERLHARLAYTYLDATVRSPYLTCSGLPAPCRTPTNLVQVGSRVPGAPQNDLYAGLRWGGNTGWHAELSGRYLSTVPVNDTNTASAPAYGLLGLGGGYVFRLSHWQMRMFLRLDNLTDTRYVGSVIVNDGNDRFYEPGPGRSVLAGVDLRWND
ncbi:MAG: TonB-dependent receptor [Gammaproteobacteria bacterium]|nr:TonB-dependent receptor [Gammaproteobacteria bacterium]